MARVFVNPEMIDESTVTITDTGDIRHITRVLRLGEGDRIEVSDKTEYEYDCIIASAAEDTIIAEIAAKRKFASEPAVKVTLFQGIPKAGKMEAIVQKCVELGIYEIVPVWTERTVVTDKGNFKKKLERWQKIADEAVKQCRRGLIPSVAKDAKLAGLSFDGYDLVLLAYENEERQSLKDCLEAIDKKGAEKPKKIAIIIGPEGGFSENEVKLMTESGARSVTLGKTILRTETAGPAMLAMIMYAMEL